MLHRHALLLAILPIFGTSACSKAPPLPTAIARFCAEVLHGDIAQSHERFNDGDVVYAGVPTRRILGYQVSGDTAAIWYEHGGRAPHQHLIRFSVASPSQILAEYRFAKAPDSSISGLLANAAFLEPTLTPNGER